MEQRLRKHVENLFADAPKSRKIVELREEIFANLKEKYYDLIHTGASEEEAYEIVVKSVGDVNELIGTCETPAPEPISEKDRKSAALLKAVSVMLFVFAPAAVIIGASLRAAVAGVVTMFALVAVGVGLQIYKKSLYAAAADSQTIVGKIKQKQDEALRAKEKRDAWKGAYWLIVTALYFLISFITGAWGITWIVFLVGAAGAQIIKAASE